MTIDATPPTDDDLPELDARARAAAVGLRAHMAVDHDVESAIGLLPAGRDARRRRGKVLAIAAALALVAATAGVIGSSTDDPGVEVEVDGDGEASPVLPPGTLTPLGPRDGKDSIQLPLTAEPHTGLVDGQEVTVSGSGFQSGEPVGIVQCAKQAMGDTDQVRAGIQACDVTGYTDTKADAAGAATGTYAVRRLLTTPLTGTVDCAAEADRCMVAMGALADYDRSGTHPISFDPNVEPVELPTIEVTPADELTDGALVHVVAQGLRPGDRLSGEVCSSDPEACTSVGLTAGEAGDEPDGSPTSTESGSVDVFSVEATGLLVDADGRAEGDLRVWQYLPGAEPGTYVDCAVSRCSLRLRGQTAPPTVALAFLPGEGPVAPNAVMEPADGVAVGDEVAVRGAGFRPGSQIGIALCAHRGDSLEEGYLGCAYGEGPQLTVSVDGTFAISYKIPEVRDDTRAMECRTEEECRTPQPGPPVQCGVDGVKCELRVESYSPDGGPIFQPPPIPITFR